MPLSMAHARIYNVCIYSVIYIWHMHAYTVSEYHIHIRGIRVKVMLTSVNE